MTHRIEVVPVETRADRRRFLKLPWTLYRGNPYWVPPLRGNQAGLLGFKRHPFYDFADTQPYLAMRNGDVCGRLSAIVNPNHNRRHHDTCGFFGFFECVDDAAVSGALFDAAVGWLQQRGMTTIRGPVNPSMNYECGLLLNRFESPPTFMMTYNPPYYANLLDDYGFQKAQDLYSYTENKRFLKSIPPKLRSIMETAKQRFGIHVRKIDLANYQHEIRCILDLFNRGTVGSWGFVPLTDAEAEHLGKELRYLIAPEFVRIAEVEGKAVGVQIGLLDFNPLIKAIDGRLFPFGFLHLLLRKRHIKRFRIMSSNVVPEFQLWGVGLVLAASMEEDSLAWGIEDGEFSWILESNHVSRNMLERHGLVKDKTFRLYDYTFGHEAVPHEGVMPKQRFLNR